MRACHVYVNFPTETFRFNIILLSPTPVFDSEMLDFKFHSHTQPLSFENGKQSVVAGVQSQAHTYT